MRASHILLCTCLVMCFAHCKVKGQFFTKTANSIPRMGRRSDSTLPNLVRRIARTLRFVVDMVQQYDQDENGELNPEELMDIPFIQNAIRNYLDKRELQELQEEKKRANHIGMNSTDEPNDEHLIIY